MDHHPTGDSLLAQQQVDPGVIIGRHRSGHRGDVDREQAMANNDAVQSGGPVRSTYPLGDEALHI